MIGVDDNWERLLEAQTLRRWENYLRKRIDLSIIRSDELWSVPGQFLTVEKVSSSSAVAAVKLNLKRNEALELSQGVEIKTLFTEFYLSNNVQAGEWLDVLIGINFEYNKTGEVLSEAEPCIILTNALPNVNTVAAANSCNRVLIRAHTGNAGTVWIDFANAAVVNACYELTAGDAISGPCSNTNRINGLFTAGGDRATIVYEV